MKLKFKTQDFQTEAVNAVADLFAGQDKQTATFSIVDNESDRQIRLINEFGIGNAMEIRIEDLLANMNDVQKRNNLPRTSDISGDGDKRFCIEMETGTDG